MKRKLEVCVDSLESACSAASAGADRLEVCANLVIGGTTPGVTQFKQIRKACQIPLHVLIRPRFGDFLYTDSEFEMIAEDVSLFRKLGADGVVVGCLTAEGDLDTDRLNILRDRGAGIHMTLHRAFDMCKNPFQALEEAVQAGVDTILTSGQRENCQEGKEILRELTIKAAGRLEIMAGGGVNAEVIKRLIPALQNVSFHMSGKRQRSSGMIYRNGQVHMGLPGMSEYEIYYTESEQIRLARQVMDAWENGIERC